MSYTYKLSHLARTETYKEVLSDISLLYPEFVQERRTEDADGSMITFYNCPQTEKHLIVEISYERKVVFVTSDVPLPELAEKYELRNAPDDVLHADVGSEEVKEFVGNTASGFVKAAIKRLSDPMTWKAVILPIICIAICFVRLKYIPVRWLLIITIFTAVAFIPAFIMSNVLSEKQPFFLHKLPISVMLIFCTVMLVISNTIGISMTTDQIVPILLTFASIFFIEIPYIDFFYLLPIIIADELAEVKYKKKFGERPHLWKSLLWWVGTFLAMLIASVLTILVVSGINTLRESHTHEVQIAEQEQEPIPTIEDITAPLYAAYGEDIITVAAYAMEHDVYDWYYCPDDSVYEAWSKLFEPSEASDDVPYCFDEHLTKDEINGTVRFHVWLNEESYFMYIFSDGETILYADYYDRW